MRFLVEVRIRGKKNLQFFLDRNLFCVVDTHYSRFLSLFKNDEHINSYHVSIVKLFADVLRIKSKKYFFFFFFFKARHDLG